jgi:nucleoside-diphosphate-sugar epimerase
MRVLLTGGTGFLGRAIVPRLVGPDAAAPRHQVVLLVRPTASRAGFPPGVTFATGDVTDRASVTAAARGCDAIVHAAALVKLVAPAAQFDRVNVGGLENVLAAAEETGVGRVVYVSSFIALGPSERGPGRTLDETAEAGERDWINDYERTKTLADRRAREAIAAGAPLVVVYPGVIYGAGAMTEGNIVVRGLLDGLHGKLPALVGEPDRRWSYVHVDDVAEGVLLALEKAPSGGRYVLGGENVRLGGLYELVEELSGVRMPRRWLPKGLAKTMGAMMKAWSQLFGGTPKLTPDLVEVCHHDWAYRSETAERALGYRHRSLREGMTQTLQWLRETGQWKARA